MAQPIPKGFSRFTAFPAKQNTSDTEIRFDIGPGDAIPVNLIVGAFR
jgi:hypothetical protein